MQRKIPNVLTKVYLQNVASIHEREIIDELTRELDSIIDCHSEEVVAMAIQRKTSHFCDFHDRYEVLFDHDMKKHFRTYFNDEDILSKYKKRFLHCKIRVMANGFVIDWSDK